MILVFSWNCLAGGLSKKTFSDDTLWLVDMAWKDPHRSTHTTHKVNSKEGCCSCASIKLYEKLQQNYLPSQM